MKLFFFFLTFLALGTTGAHAAQTETNSGFKDTYISAGYVFGTTTLKDNNVKAELYEPSFNIGIGSSIAATDSEIGTLRLAADWTYRSIEFEIGGEKFDILFNTFGANAYYDFKTNTIVTPYLHTMLGATYTSMSVANQDKSKIKLAWGVGLGLSFKINEKTAIDLGYKYGENFGKMSMFGAKGELEHSDFLLNLRLHF